MVSDIVLQPLDVLPPVSTYKETHFARARSIPREVSSMSCIICRLSRVSCQTRGAWCRVLPRCCKSFPPLIPYRETLDSLRRDERFHKDKDRVCVAVPFSGGKSGASKSSWQSAAFNNHHRRKNLLEGASTTDCPRRPRLVRCPTAAGALGQTARDPSTNADRAQRGLAKSASLWRHFRSWRPKVMCCPVCEMGPKQLIYRVVGTFPYP